MEIIAKQAQGKLPITILQPYGDLDASNYQTLIAKGQEVYHAGGRYILLDMSHIPFMGSSGLVALHSLALLLRGEELLDPESGWSAFHALENDRDSGLQQQLKILNPQAQVDRVLEMSGLKEFFEVHTDLETALAAFG
jgi:anti-anti-sigma regulatory factor